MGFPHLFACFPCPYMASHGHVRPRDPSLHGPANLHHLGHVKESLFTPDLVTSLGHVTPRPGAPGEIEVEAGINRIPFQETVQNRISFANWTWWFCLTKNGHMLRLQWQMLVCQSNIEIVPSNTLILQSIIVKLVCSVKWKMLKLSTTINFYIYGNNDKSWLKPFETTSWIRMQVPILDSVSKTKLKHPCEHDWNSETR